jgi:hypothetical protein
MTPLDPPYYMKDLDKLTPAERSAALSAYDALAYEIEMLNETAELAVEHWDNPKLRKVLIESFALHCRNLVEFLWKSQIRAVRAPRVRANHYWQESKTAWPSLRKLDGADALWDKASQQIAHLTTGRLSNSEDERKRWEFQAGVALLHKGLEAFDAQADRTKYSPSVERALAGLRRIVSTPSIWHGLAHCVGNTQLGRRG